jgi:type VI secretion system protein ImpM
VLKRSLDSFLVTHPAIWGKVPGHADFVSCGQRKGESEAWADWLSVLPEPPPERRLPASAALPVAFVLPPGALTFASRRFVVGVIARSFDRLGRSHALVAYQVAHPRWLLRHLALHADYPHDWFFWLARTIARHAGLSEAADIRALERAIDELWGLHGPTAAQLLPAAWRPAAQPAALVSRSRALLDRLLGTASPDDVSQRLVGVRFMPWTDWPERVRTPGFPNRKASMADAEAGGRTRFHGAFWQQDDSGGFVNAAVRLDTLWSGSP